MPRFGAPRLPGAVSYLACWFSDAARQQVEGHLAGPDPTFPVTAAGWLTDG